MLLAPVEGLDFNDRKVKLRLFTDASWGSREDARSTEGAMVFINDSMWMYSAKVQNSVSLSTCESEFRALANGTRTLLYGRNILEEDLGMECNLKCFTDNEPARKVATQRSSAHLRFDSTRLYVLLQSLPC